jgi:hypothetical protein
MLKLEKMPSPTGRNAEHLYILRVPPRGMAYDSKDGLMPGQTELSPWEKVIELAREGGLDGEKMSIFEQALASLCKHAEAGTAQADDDLDDDPENALDTLGRTVASWSPKGTQETFETGSPTGLEKEGSRVDRRSDRPEWASDPERRRYRWSLVSDFLRKKGVGDSDISGFQKQWVEMFGALPKNALTGAMGGLTASDRKLARDRARARQQAADARATERWPESSRLNAQSALENRYGEEPATAHGRGLSAGTISRWGDVLDRIRHV